MRFMAYPKYKPSGVEWLGDVPEHWEIVPLKHLCVRSALYGANIAGEDYVQDGVRFLRTTDIDDFGQLQPGGVFIEPEQAQGYELSDGDLLLSRSGTIGRAFVYAARQHPKSAYAGYLVRFVPSSRLNPNFAFYFTKGLAFRDWLDTQVISSTIGNVNGQKYAQCPLPLADRIEQDAIVEFLDHETAKIDTLVAMKRTLIERLKEKRTALISRTVTRGLPPGAARAAGLDPHPKLKPSGIDWLGDVPEDWDIGKFSREVRIAEGQADPEVEPYCSMLLVAPNHIESGTGRLLAQETAADQGAISGKYMCRAGEVIYSKIRPALAKAVLAPEDCLCSADMYPMTSTGRLQSRFLLLTLLSMQFTAWSVLEADRVAMPKVNRETLSALRLPVPPLREQEKIADFLDQATAKIDAMVATVGTAIERLQEYRIALITAAVTGKIDVRNVHE